MPERLKLAIIGDPHLAIAQGEPDPLLEIDPGRKLHALSRELLAETIAQINREPAVDAVVILGDMTRDSEEFNHLVARELIQTLRMPYYIVLGNHDLGLERRGHEHIVYPGARRFGRDEMQDFYRGSGLPGNSSDYSVKLPGGVRLIVLDSTLAPSEHELSGIHKPGEDDGWLAPQQLGWLAEELASAAEGGELALPVLHHTLLTQTPVEHEGHVLESTFRFWRVRNAKAALTVLDRHPLPLVLSGHLHAQSTNVHAGMLNLVTSATVGYPHAWRLITVTTDAIHIESRRLTAIPSCPDLQSHSRAALDEGMGEMVRHQLRNMGPLSRLAEPLAAMVQASGWWAHFCDGTMAGFKVDPAFVPHTDPLNKLLVQQIVGILNEYGAWKSARPEPNTLELPLNLEKRIALFR